jgi:uncharacterized membrane protein YjjP (DUF1212 family)
MNSDSSKLESWINLRYAIPCIVFIILRGLDQSTFLPVFVVLILVGYFTTGKRFKNGVKTYIRVLSSLTCVTVAFLVARQITKVGAGVVLLSLVVANSIDWLVVRNPRRLH